MTRRRYHRYLTSLRWRIRKTIASAVPSSQFERNGLGWLIMLVVASQKEFTK